MEGYAEYDDMHHGDFYLCRSVGPNLVCAAMVSCSGKGPSAALLGAFFSKMNRDMEGKGMMGRLICLTLVVLDTRSGQIWIDSRGNRSVPVLHQNGGTALIRLADLPPLGVMPEEIVQMKPVKPKSFKLSPGDILFLSNGPFDEIPGTDEGGPAFLASMLGAAYAPRPDTVERSFPWTFFLERCQAESLANIVPNLTCEPHTDHVTRIPANVFEFFTPPVALTLRWNAK